MAIVNFITHEVQLKIVLHGPPSSGRAVTLTQLHASSPDSRDGLAIHPKDSGKPLSFSYLAGASDAFEGFTTRVEFHTHSGGLCEGAALERLLQDADGIILVADSQWERLEDNVRSLQDIEEVLKKEKIALEEIPYVLQYNKRDLQDVAPANYIDFLLNNRPNPAPIFETIATTGENLAAMRDALVGRVIGRVKEIYPQTAEASEPVAA